MTKTSKEAALDAFMGKKCEIDDLLAKIQEMSDDHFCVHPDSVNWGHVGTLEFYVNILRQIAPE